MDLSDKRTNHPGATFLFANISETGPALVTLTAPNHHRARVISALAIGSFIEISLRFVPGFTVDGEVIIRHNRLVDDRLYFHQRTTIFSSERAGVTAIQLLQT
jgi:hypothetical protein